MMQKGVVPSVGGEGSGGPGFWKPPDSKGGRNEVVLLVKPDDIWATPNQVKLWKDNKFGGASYPVNATWVDTGKNDPRHVLCPGEKPKYAAGIWVAYQDDSGEWKAGMWSVSKAVHTAIVNLYEDADVHYGVVNIMMVNKRWTVNHVSKKIAPAEAKSVQPGDDETTKRLLGLYEDSDAVWEMLQEKLEVSSREEVMDAFGVGDDADLI